MKTKDFWEYFFVSENFETCNFFCSPTERILIELKPLESTGNLNGWSDSRAKNLGKGFNESKLSAVFRRL